MNQSTLKRLLPHLLAYFLMMAISFIFFSPYVFEGKVLTQGDNVRARGMQGEITKVEDETGERPLWTNSMFGGMPSYQIQMSPGNNLTRIPYGLLFLKQSVTKPHTVVLVAMICCYLLLITLGVDWRLSIIGAVAFGLSNYQIDLAEAGHSTKMAAVALLPGVFAGALLTYRGKYLLGGALFGLFMAMEILANHLQITFYAGWMLVILGIVQFIGAIRKGTMNNFIKASAILVATALLGVAANADRIWVTQEYAKETIRGTSELSSKGGKDGLTKDYIFAWSYGIKESMTLLIPNFNGGGRSQHFRGTKTHDLIYRNMVANFSQSMPRDAAIKSAEAQVAALMYWGNQPMVGVAIYFGAIIVFLFFLGAFLVPGEIKAWLVASAIFTLMLAWGGNFFLNGFLVDYVPMFNKFRAVSMALGLTHLAVVLLAILGLQAFFSKQYTVAQKQKALMIALGITGGLCLLALVGSFMMDFSNPAKDSRYPANILPTILEDRGSILRMDALRSLLFIGLAAGSLFVFLKGKIKVLVAVLLVGVLSILDVWLVNKRILFAEKYETPKQARAAANPTPVDQQIMADPDPHFRVLDLSRGMSFTSADASYFHKSIGGYHAAKLMIFQDVAERYLSPQYGQNPLEHLNILGMLNTKYVIQGGQEGSPPQVAKLSEALGNAWFVEEYKTVPSADAEIAALANLDPRKTAILRQSEADKISGLTITRNPADNIRLTSYHPDKMTYEYSAANDRLAVFSEIYYPESKGWKIYLDGQAMNGALLRADYLLRAAKLPAGKHTVEMRFEPRAWYIGGTIALVTSILLIVGFLAALFLHFKGREVPVADHLSEMELVPERKVKVKEEVKATKPKRKKKKK